MEQKMANKTYITNHFHAFKGPQSVVYIYIVGVKESNSKSTHDPMIFFITWSVNSFTCVLKIMVLSMAMFSFWQFH